MDESKIRENPNESHESQRAGGWGPQNAFVTERNEWALWLNGKLWFIVDIH